MSSDGKKPMTGTKLFLIAFLIIWAMKACTATLFSYQMQDNIGLCVAYLLLFVILFTFSATIWGQYFPLPKALRFMQSPFRGWVGRPNWRLQIEETSDTITITSSYWRYMSIAGMTLAFAVGTAIYMYNHSEMHSFARAFSIVFIAVSTMICLNNVWIWRWRTPKILVRSSSIEIWKGKQLLKTIWKHQLEHLEVEKYWSSENLGSKSTIRRPNYMLKACTQDNTTEYLCTTEDSTQMDQLSNIIGKRLELIVKVLVPHVAGYTTPLP